MCEKYAELRREGQEEEGGKQNGSRGALRGLNLEILQQLGTIIIVQNQSWHSGVDGSKLRSNQLVRKSGIMIGNSANTVIFNGSLSGTKSVGNTRAGGSQREAIRTTTQVIEKTLIITT